MRSIKTIGLIAMAVLALSAVAASTAAAEEFIASKTGKLTGKALNTQVFVAKSGGAQVECTGATPSGEVTQLKSEEQKVSITWSGCKVFGIGAATVSLADLTFVWNKTLTKWSVSILLVNIDIETTFPKCHILVAFGQLFDSGLTLKNSTSGTGKKSIVGVGNIEGIASEVTESESASLCGKVGEKSTTGTYKGEVETELEGAGNNIEVK